MSEENNIEMTETDLKNHVRGYGKPAPSHVLERVMESVREQEKEQKKEMSREELDKLFGRKPQQENEHEQEQ